MEEKSIAMEMLQELKRANKRNFITIIILLVALIVSNISWLIYESQYETFGEETIYTQEAESSDDSSINQDIS